MKKLGLLFLVIIFIPQVAFAAWWNPFSWKIFQRETIQTQNNVVDTTDTTALISKKNESLINLYIKVNGARLRSCPSTSCEVLGWYKVSDVIVVSTKTNDTFNSLPDWLQTTTPEGVVGYINKSVLSETPVSEQINNQQVVSKKVIETNGITNADINTVNGWLSYIDVEVEAGLDLIDQINESVISNSADEVLDTIEVYVQNLRAVKSQIISAVTANKRDTTVTLLTRVQKLKDDFDIDFKLSMNNSLQDAKRSASNARLKAAEAAYRQATAERQAINQASIDASNAYVERYNALRKDASENGVTEAVFNAQLNAAGLIKQTTCSFSAVGGMTPGAGSMTCY